MNRIKGEVAKNPFLGMILLGLALKFVATYLELQIPKLMQIVLDEKVPAGQEEEIYLFGGLMVVCCLVAVVMSITANRIASKAAGKITRKLRHDLFDKLQHLSPRQMDAVTVPSAVSRLTSDSYNVNNLIVRIQRIGVRAPILLLGGIVMMLRMDASLALILIALLPIIAVVVYFVTKTSLPLYTRQQTVLDKVVRTLQENITGIRVIKALSKTDYEKQRFHTVNDELTAVDQKAGTITAITNPTSTLTLNLGLTLVVVVGAFRVNGGSIDSGVIVAFLQYFTMILMATMGITRVFIMWSRGEASAKRVAEVLALPEDLTVLPAELTEEEQNTVRDFFDEFSAHCKMQKRETEKLRRDFENAVRTAAAAACAGDVVLMSPASASFDQFKNFMVRGDYYKKLIREL